MIFQFLRRGAFVAVLAFLGLFFALRVPQTYAALRVKNEQIRKLQRHNADLKKDNAERKKWIDDLTSNRSEQENLLRREYHKQRQGDTTFMLQPDQKPAK
jgi:cell division protein FtsB